MKSKVTGTYVGSESNIVRGMKLVSHEYIKKDICLECHEEIVQTNIL